MGAVGGKEGRPAARRTETDLVPGLLSQRRLSWLSEFIEEFSVAKLSGI